MTLPVYPSDLVGDLGPAHSCLQAAWSAMLTRHAPDRQWHLLCTTPLAYVSSASNSSTHNMQVFKTGNRTGFLWKCSISFKLSLELSTLIDRGLGIRVEIFTQIQLYKAAIPQQAEAVCYPIADPHDLTCCSSLWNFQHFHLSRLALAILFLLYY